MAAVTLHFIPPDEPNLVALRILEGATATGPFSLIERVTPVGTFPGYINEYTTVNAAFTNDWFSIQWENALGAVGEASAPIQGGVRTLVAELVDRVMLRDSSLNEAIVAQEAEAVIDRFKNVDPYTLVADDVRYKELQALADLVLVYSKLSTFVIAASSGTASSYTAGLVSETFSTSSNQQQNSALSSLEALEKRALKILGRGGSLIGQLQTPAMLSISGLKTFPDQSRLLSTTAIITEQATLRDIV